MGNQNLNMYPKKPCFYNLFENLAKQKITAWQPFMNKVNKTYLYKLRKPNHLGIHVHVMRT